MNIRINFCLLSSNILYLDIFALCFYSTHCHSQWAESLLDAAVDRGFLALSRKISLCCPVSAWVPRCVSIKAHSMVGLKHACILAFWHLGRNPLGCFMAALLWGTMCLWQESPASPVTFNRAGPSLHGLPLLAWTRITLALSGSVKHLPRFWLMV